MSTKLEQQINIMNAFKENMTDFFDELIEQYPSEEDLLIMRFFLSEQIPMETLLTQFIRHVLPLRQAISKRDESFFLENENIFGTSPKDKVIRFKNLYLGMNKEDRVVLFQWFDSFIAIADQYIVTLK